jgi:hypothetical protein
VAYRALEVDDKVKISNYGFNNHGSYGVVTALFGDKSLVRYVSWQSHGRTLFDEMFDNDKLLLSSLNKLPTCDEDYTDDEELYEGNLLERIMKLEQEIVDLKKQLA